MQCDMVLLKRPTSLRSETAERQFYIRMGRAERWAAEFCSDQGCFYSSVWFSSQLRRVFTTGRPFYGDASLTISS